MKRAEQFLESCVSSQLMNELTLKETAINIVHVAGTKLVVQTG